MKRQPARGSRGEGAALSTVVGAAQQGRGWPGGGHGLSAAAIQVEKVGDNLSMLRGGGRTVSLGGVNLPTAGTTAAFITAGGVVLVDTKLTAARIAAHSRAPSPFSWKARCSG